MKLPRFLARLDRVTNQLSVLIMAVVAEGAYEVVKWDTFPGWGKIGWTVFMISLRVWIPKMERQSVDVLKRKSDFPPKEAEK